MYIVHKQVSGMLHIRNLKAAARKLWEHYDNEPELWIDCLKASMRQCRIALQKDERQKQENQNEIIHDLFFREYVLGESEGA